MRVETMARKKKPEAEAADPHQMRIDGDIATKAKHVALHLGMTFPNYINSRMRTVVMEEYRQIMKALNDELQKPDPK